MGNKATKQGDSTIVSSTSSISNNNANSQAQSNNENQLSSASNNKPFPPSPSSIAASNIFSSSSYTKGGVRGSKDVIQLRKKTQEKYISRAKEVSHVCPSPSAFCNYHSHCVVFLYWKSIISRRQVR